MACGSAGLRSFVVSAPPMPPAPHRLRTGYHHFLRTDWDRQDPHIQCVLAADWVRSGGSNDFGDVLRNPWQEMCLVTDVSSWKVIV